MTVSVATPTAPADGCGAVTVCIPAFEAAGFIDRTLRCARDQTYLDQRILVSIDVSDDDTEEICRRHASQDPRVEVVAQRERLGWAANVNFLLDRTNTEFAFLYFHDDVIDPLYTARLVGALRDRPDAASAHCDMGLFGGSNNVVPGRDYEGSAPARLLDFLTASRKPALLRSLIRTALGGDIRLPTGAGGVWANQPFLMKLVAAGPVLHVPETLYRRWDKREGGLTDGWRSLPFEEIVEGYRTNAEVALQIIDGLRPLAEEREALLFGLLVHMTLRLRQAEIRYDARSVHPPDLLLSEFADMTIPPAVRRLPAPLRTQCEDAYDRLQRRTGKRALDVGDYAQAAAAYEDLTDRHPNKAALWRRLSDALRGMGRSEEAEEATRQAQRVRHAGDARKQDSSGRERARRP